MEKDVTWFRKFDSKLLMALVGATVVHTLFVAGCSPVNFAKNEDKTNGCPVNQPCLMADGTKRIYYTVTFNQSNRVDVLVVVDNSGSMETEQQNLSAPFNGFIANLNKNYPQVADGQLDWQIGVINTDMCGSGPKCTGNFFEGGLGRFMNQLGLNPAYGNFVLNRNTANIAQVFANTVQRGSQIGHGDERPIASALMALDVNRGFFRDNSNLAIVILSDEDERSVGGLDPNDQDYVELEDADKPLNLIGRVAELWPGKSLKIHSIIVKPGDTACLNQQRSQGPYFTSHYGEVLKRAADQTGGAVGSICDNGSGSFASMLSSITGAIVSQPNSNVVSLPQIPMQRPAASWNNEAYKRPFTWNIGTREIVFTQRPPSGASVTFEILYKDAEQKTLSAFAGAQSANELPTGHDQ